MTQTILDLMNVRGQYKNKNIKRYNEIHREIGRKIKATKDQWSKINAKMITLMAMGKINIEHSTKIKAIPEIYYVAFCIV